MDAKHGVGRGSEHVHEQIQQLIEGRHHDPFQLLGAHPLGEDQALLRVFVVGAYKVDARFGDERYPMSRVRDEGVFEARLPVSSWPLRYELEIHYGHGSVVTRDPYSFVPVLSDFDLQLFAEGNHHRLWEVLGARPLELDDVLGVLFAVWAPNAERVSVVGGFNDWNGLRHPMRVRGQSGVWELFIPGLQIGETYKFEVRSADGRVFLKSDPYAFTAECRPATASRVCDLSFSWSDEGWCAARAQSDTHDRPLAIYEVHLGSWMRRDGDEYPFNYREIAPLLADYVLERGFTHVELLPVMEHPFDGSWGYQVTGYFAPTSRYGSPQDFMYFVDYMHARGLGVILDWVPAHFPRDAHGLARFDGTPLYEHGDPRKGEHRDWGTYIFNYGRNEVRNFLISSALFWIEMFHVDGLRVDAVTSMICLNFSREDGEWEPNRFGGWENLDAISFLQQLNNLIHQYHPGTLTFAEESTNYTCTSRSGNGTGLGFDYKWAMGWMNDSLRHFAIDPIFRSQEHEKLTFFGMYFLSEFFILPISHDEVVHLKKSLLEKMPGDEWQKFANLRLFFAYQMTMPGKKLLFMGCEFGQWHEWSEATGLDWHLLEYEPHQAALRMLTDLVRLYRDEPVLYEGDHEAWGFGWLVPNDALTGVLAYRRSARDGRFYVVVLNLTPVPRTGYRFGVPRAGVYVEVLNTDKPVYWGSGLSNEIPLIAQPEPWGEQPCTLELTLPPLGALILRHEPEDLAEEIPSVEADS